MEIAFYFCASTSTKKYKPGDVVTHLGAVEPRGHEPSSFFCSITRTCGRRQKEKRAPSVSTSLNIFLHPIPLSTEIEMLSAL